MHIAGGSVYLSCGLNLSLLFGRFSASCRALDSNNSLFTFVTSSEVLEPRLLELLRDEINDNLGAYYLGDGPSILVLGHHLRLKRTLGRRTAGAPKLLHTGFYSAHFLSFV